MALAKSQKSLKDWGKQKWRTSSGKPSKGKRRYLPDAAWKALSASEKAATNRAKAKGGIDDHTRKTRFMAYSSKVINTSLHGGILPNV